MTRQTSPVVHPPLPIRAPWVLMAGESLEAQRARVKIDGRKPGFEAVSIYCRKKGDVQWRLIAVRKRKFPFYDEAPLAVPGTPEVREYMAIGIINDEETGQPSEIKEVVYAG